MIKPEAVPGTVELTGEVNHENRAVCKQGERGVYMMQARISICGLVDELNKKLSNASECYSRAKKCSNVARKNAATSAYNFVHNLRLLAW